MERERTGRRAFLTSALAGGVALSGCLGFGSSQQSNQPIALSDFRGSGPLVAERPELGGTSIAELPDLSGELSLYLGGGEGGLYKQLIELLQRKYPDFTARTRLDSTASLANTIIEETEAGESRADVFWAVDAGALGVVADAGATVDLPKSVLKPVPDSFQGRKGQWVGVAGRARSIPYNTDSFDGSEMPDSIYAFAKQKKFEGVMGWAPTYGAFQSFVTAMRLLRGEQRTKEWLRGMLSQGVSEYPDEFIVSNAVADGEIKAGFANHYYALRVKAARPDAPIDLAFTTDDAGALVNVSGAEIMQGTKKKDLAVTFIRHLLSTEAQEFFATRAYSYPMVPEVPPVGGLPRVDELNPPELKLSKLSNLQKTLELMREVGVL